jgi:hypothetical protein
MAQGADSEIILVGVEATTRADRTGEQNYALTAFQALRDHKTADVAASHCYRSAKDRGGAMDDEKHLLGSDERTSGGVARMLRDLQGVWSAHSLRCYSLVLGIGAVACSSSSTANRDACQAVYNNRGDTFFVIEISDGGVGDAGDAGVEVDFDAASCEAQCVAEASRRQLMDPRFKTCTQSSISIGCTFDTLQPLPCDVAP